MNLHAQNWGTNALAEIEHQWGRLGDAHIDEGIAAIRTLVNRLQGIKIDTTNLQ